MSYSRPPNTLVVGTALRQSPQSYPCEPAGIVISTIQANIATTSSLGVVQVGSGLSITVGGILSTAGDGGLINVKLTAVNYTALASDYYIGGTASGIIITLPLGVTGKVYYIKNQTTGNFRVEGSGGQTINAASFKTLGTEDAIIVVFDGTRWNVV